MDTVVLEKNNFGNHYYKMLRQWWPWIFFALIVSGVTIIAELTVSPIDNTMTLWKTKFYNKCEKEGYHPDYSTGCREYVDCKEGEVKSRNFCANGFIFSTVAQQCLSSTYTPCILHQCADGDTSPYASPGTKCSHFYYCSDGVAMEEACSPGTWFDNKQGLCIKDPGICREPVCAGRRDGLHPDTTHKCRRALNCKESKLRGVISCPPGELFGGKTCVPADKTTCEHPKKDTVAYTVGDSDPTDDCLERLDGYYPDISTRCTNFFYCAEERRIFKKSCENGKVFNGNLCVFKDLYYCPIDSKNPCQSKKDGFHRDLKDCQSFYYCQESRTTFRDSCQKDLVWDGKSCVNPKEFTCLGPIGNSPLCKGKTDGFYQDRSLKSLCKRYYYCESETLLEFECPNGKLFDGEQCTSKDIYTCPSLESDSCDFKSDGYYKQTTGGCRGYYLCSKNVKIVFVCDDNFVFNGKKCVSRNDYKCPYNTNDCQNKSNGYHKDIRSNCRNYYYCENGEKITTFQCPGVKIYNGQNCVSADDYECPVGSAGNLCAFKRDGFHLLYGSNCQSYYRCINYRLASYHTCDINTRFDGVDSCTVNFSKSAKCSKDGFFADLSVRCRSYYSCINGRKTKIECPENKVFNGDLCVPADTYTCPEECL